MGLLLISGWDYVCYLRIIFTFPGQYRLGCLCFCRSLVRSSRCRSCYWLRRPCWLRPVLSSGCQKRSLMGILRHFLTCRGGKAQALASSRCQIWSEWTLLMKLAMSICPRTQPWAWQLLFVRCRWLHGILRGRSRPWYFRRSCLLEEEGSPQGLLLEVLCCF